MIDDIEYIELPDERLKRRLELLVEEMSGGPGRSIPEMSGGWPETKGAYRFYDNKRVSREDIVAGQRAACMARLREQPAERVLLVQDTTSFDFKHHPETSGMGPLENKATWGFMAHSTLMVSEAGVPLGMWEQQVWVRDEETVGKREQRHERAFETKESYKWVLGLPDLSALKQVTQVITVCDREAHIYKFIDKATTQGADFIVRASRGRSFTQAGKDIFAEVAEWPVQKSYSLALPRRPQRPARDAQVELRFGTLTLPAPRRAQATHATLTVQLVEVIEPNPPPDQEAVHWLLLTSLPVLTLAQAQQIVTWYTYRWLIERFHYVLKSGCKLEMRQLQSQARLERLLAVCNLVAWRLLWLTYQARLTPNLGCALTTDEWQALYAYHHRSTRLPSTPPTLQQATRWIAQLGGFLGRKSDGEPGVKVLWRGWMRLQDITDTWLLLHPPPKNVGNA